MEFVEHTLSAGFCAGALWTVTEQTAPSGSYGHLGCPTWGRKSTEVSGSFSLGVVIFFN